VAVVAVLHATETGYFHLLITPEVEGQRKLMRWKDFVL